MSLKNDDSKTSLFPRNSIRLQQIEPNEQGRSSFARIVTKLYFNLDKIEFEGYEDLGNNPEFIRYKTGKSVNSESVNEMVKEVYQLLNLRWKGKKPELVISVIGGFKRMNITKRQRKIFKQGLIDIMKRCRTVIITGGFNVGIHKLVGECVHEFKNLNKNEANDVYLIGISSWGVVWKNDCLERNEGNTRCVYPRCIGNISERRQVELDPFCNFFIFCDDGTEKQYDKEIEFRSLFERHAQTEENGFLVQILFEGGYRSISRAHQTLKNKISIVVINHSGRAANLLSEVMKKNDDSIERRLEIVEGYKKPLNIPMDDVDEIKNCLKDMYEQYNKQIFIYDMKSYTTKLDSSIVEAVMAGLTKSSPKHILKLSIQFNCIDIAKKYLKSKYSEIDDDQINKRFIKALEDDKFEFVKFFLEKDYQYENVVNKEILEKLYWKNVLYQTDLNNVGKRISNLSGNILKNIYLKKSDFEIGYQDLFLWALLCKRINLAKLFWENGKCHVSSALIGSIILTNIASNTLKQGDSEHQKELMKEASYFEDFAIRVLTRAFNENQEDAILIITRKLRIWNDTSCFDIALSGKLLNFLNHSACTSYATSVWMGELSPLLHLWKILLNIPFSLCFIQRLIKPSIQKKTSTNEMKISISNSNDLDHFMSSPEEGKTDPMLSSSSTDVKDLTFCEIIGKFYSAPIVKFYINFAFYISFLIIFAYLNLVELKPLNGVNGLKDVPAEIYVYTYVVSFILEEIRQVYDQNESGFISKMKGYFSGSCNQQDVFIIVVFTVSIIVRLLLLDDNFMICRCLFGICYSMFCLRTLQFYFAYEFVGPKVIMIGKMLRDICFFLSIFVLFIVSFGTLSQSLRSPNSAMNLTLINDIFKVPYFQIFGELMLDKVLDEQTCHSINCFVQYTTIILGLALYLLLTNILLVNLLIAMFGYTFNLIHSDSRKHWSYIRLQLVKEFYRKPVLSPPLNVLCYCYRFISHMFPGEKDEEDNNNPLLKKLSPADDLMITDFEKKYMDEELTHYFNNATNSTERNCENLKGSCLTNFDMETKNRDLHVTCQTILDTLRIMSMENHEFRATCEKRFEKLENDLDRLSSSR